MAVAGLLFTEPMEDERRSQVRLASSRLLDLVREWTMVFFLESDKFY